jgi:diguanylate cyclase (GGDEF)-like protein
MAAALTSPRQPGRGGVVAHAALILLAGVVVVLGRPFADWNVGLLLVIGAFTVLSGLTYTETSNSGINVQGTPLGLMVAATLLGGGPAACLGAVTILFMQFRLRSPAHYLRNNLVTFIWFPLIGALCFRAIIDAFAIGRGDLAFYAAVIPAFIVAIGVNFVGSVGYSCWLKRLSLASVVRETLLPVIWVELLASLLTTGAVWLTVRTGTLGIALLGMMFLVFQKLAGELLKSKARALELHRLATTDGLTGLVNRETFIAELSRQISAARPGTALTVSLIDLDRFKDINDTLGHHYGDVLLREIAGRLQTCVGAEGTVARLGGDEFVVLASETAGDPDAIAASAQSLVECLEAPIEIDEIVVSVGASIGIAQFPDDGEDINELIRRADVAMYAAKEAQTGFALYAADLDHHSVRRLSLLGELSRALGDDQLVVHFQPIISADSYATQGVECLIRWQHPEHGLLYPGAFIEQCAHWRRGGQDLFVAVNLSVRNLHNPDLPDEIATLLARHGLEPSALKLEITESTIMADPELVAATTGRLEALGVRLSVDDFGTGFSSLAYLKNLPISELKIDRSFVSSMLSHESDLIIVRSTINLAHDLGLRVVAEGVEDAATLLALSNMGCDLIQGFHVSKPLPVDELTRWMTHAVTIPLAAEPAVAPASAA